MTALATALALLLQNDEPIKATSLTAKQRRALADYAKQTQLITFRRQGRSDMFACRDRLALDIIQRQMQPLTDEQITADIPIRSHNIGINKNSKRGGARQDITYVLLKATSNQAIWHNESHHINLAEMTNTLGAMALALDNETLWHSTAPLLMVENKDLFDRLDWLPADFNGSVLYYQGQLSNNLLSWLASRPRATEIILFPDYDGVGLQNYARLRLAELPVPCRFYLMPNWQDTLRRFGNAALWQKTKSQFDSALSLYDWRSSELYPLIEQMRTQGLALEQEVVWL